MWVLSAILATLVACSPQPRPSMPTAGATTMPETLADLPPAVSAGLTSESPPPSAGEVTPSVSLLDIDDVPPPVLVLPPHPTPMPLIVGAHGAGGSPEWNCDWLPSVLPSPAVLLCLRGIPMGRDGGSFYYPEHHSLGRWLQASYDYVTQKHSARLSATSAYVAYSQGATMGALAIQVAASPIPNLLLIEGGVDGWTAQRSRAFARAGGRRVYFACGTQSCNTKAKAKAAAVRLKEANVEVQVHHAEGAGHTPLGEVSTLVRSGLEWLLGDSRATLD